jgi:polyphosphate kinase
LGRFLEHSRIYYFHNSGQEEYFIGSADIMHRNLDRRVEALVRIDQDKHKARLQSILDESFSDLYSTWKLTDDHTWKRNVTDASGSSLVNYQDNFVDRHNRA